MERCVCLGILSTLCPHCRSVLLTAVRSLSQASFHRTCSGMIRSLVYRIDQSDGELTFSRLSYTFSPCFWIFLFVRICRTCWVIHKTSTDFRFFHSLKGKVETAIEDNGVNSIQRCENETSAVFFRQSAPWVTRSLLSVNRMLQGFNDTLVPPRQG